VKPGVSHKGEKHRLNLFENGLLRKTFVFKGEKVTGDWKKKNMYKEDLGDMYSSQNTGAS